MTTDEYIAWAQEQCPEKVASAKVPLREACGIYDAVDARLGDDAEGDDFFSRAMWLETAIRLARVGWRIGELEAVRWPVGQAGNVEKLIRSGF